MAIRLQLRLRVHAEESLFARRHGKFPPHKRPRNRLQMRVSQQAMADYEGFKDYFYSRRQWIFALMTLLFLADIADTFIKGPEYVRSLGVFFYVRTFLYIGLSAAAIKIKSEKFHAAFAIFGVLCEVTLILKSYLTVA